ncbi:MAG: L-threonylcarbamoyladenylate synthase [Candidatus Nezhaarchaeota archaeon]|nr:L-threonylcarbamoyladenylate synthase [Candidatus Nezhaarchaeota archaeon]
MAKVLKLGLVSLDEAVAEASLVIKSGGLVVYPTDTVYGLGADPFNEAAVEKAFEAKRRESKPMPVLVSSVKAARRLVYVSEEAAALMKRFWPGALTIVLPSRGTVPSRVTAGLNSLGVRMPNHSVALRLIDACGGALIGTSANISGLPPPKTVEEALAQIGGAVDLAIDAGPAPHGLPSTVVDLSSSEPKLIREGVISWSEVLEVLKR